MQQINPLPQNGMWVFYFGEIMKHPVESIQWIPAEDLNPNDYNIKLLPGSAMKHELIPFDFKGSEVIVIIDENGEPRWVTENVAIWWNIWCTSAPRLIFWYGRKATVRNIGISLR
jgi:hypothetical protein